ncbi:hypothetical protein HUJ04_012892 [Dendroctonus ponderosae]|nr:hypothetical protein HUJ04_012892 [Dendroctonus ponderosae]
MKIVVGKLQCSYCFNTSNVYPKPSKHNVKPLIPMCTPGGTQLMEFCPHGTRLDCEKNSITDCKKLHFKKIIQKHTDESLG